MKRHAPIAPCLALLLAAGGCARLGEVKTLETRPVGPPERTTRHVGTGFLVSGVRDGARVRALAEAVERCVDVTRQRHAARIRTVRTPEGSSLLLEWIAGGALLAGGTAVIVLNALRPPEPPDYTQGEVHTRSESGAYVFGGVLGALGGGFLAGAAWQTSQLGDTSVDLPEQVSEKAGLQTVCARKPAPGAKVRMTLPDGATVEAVAGPDGVADLPLPLGVDELLQAGGRRRVTLDVERDPRGAGRVDL